VISSPIKLSLLIYSLLKLQVLNTSTKEHCIGGIDHGVTSKVLNQKEGENMMVMMGFTFSRCLLQIIALVTTFSKWNSSAQLQSLPLQRGVQVHNYNHYFFNVEFKRTTVVIASFRVEFQVHNRNHYLFNVEFKCTIVITTSSTWNSSAQL